MGTSINAYPIFQAEEQNAIEEYYKGLNNPPSLEYLQDEYPDEAESVNSIFDDIVLTYDTLDDNRWLVNGTGKRVPKEEIDAEKREFLLEHHNKMELSRIKVAHTAYPFRIASTKINQILSQYPGKSYMSKKEYLQIQYRTYRDFINTKIHSEDRLFSIADCGWDEISDTFDIDDPSQYQELLTAYFIAFLCDYFSNNHGLTKEECNTNFHNAFEMFIKVSSKVKLQDPSGLFDVFNDWFAEGQSPAFEFEYCPNKEVILEMLEDLSITNGGKYCGGERSKSQVLGFVRACKEAMLLPEESDDILCEQIARTINMDYQARLKWGDKCAKTYKQVQNLIKSTKKA